MINPVFDAAYLSKYKPTPYQNSTEIAYKSVHLPSSTGLSSDKIEYICEQSKICANG